jgi:hypothetical protein
MANIRIRPADPDDAPALVTLRASVLPFLVRGERRRPALVGHERPGARASGVAGWPGSRCGQGGGGRARLAYTGNDEANRPMLAVNAWLGYRAVATQWSCMATLWQEIAHTSGYPIGVSGFST